jgi:acetyl esterase/lipase
MSEESEKQNTSKDMRQIAMLPVVYQIPGMENVLVKSDLKYKGVNDTQALMDVYSPPALKASERLPAVLFIHGSVPPGAPAKNMGVFKSWGRLAASSGMIGVTFTHRLGYPKPMLADAAHDVMAAIEFVRANAASLNIDNDRLCLAVFSGGGPMLSLALLEKPAYIRCLVAFYALLDLQQSELHQTHETAHTISTFSPIAYLDSDAENIPPMFIARAGLDQIPALNDSIDRFVTQAIAKNVSVVFANHPHGVHGFDTLTDDATSRGIIQAALAFMNYHLRLI